MIREFSNGAKAGVGLIKLKKEKKSSNKTDKGTCDISGYFSLELIFGATVIKHISHF